MKKHLAVLAFILICGICTSQENGLLAYMSFDDCTPRDVTGTLADSVNGNPECVCGLSGSGLKFDGIDDFVAWSGDALEEFLLGDFTISFYLKEPNFSSIQDILSFRENCGIDSALAITYEPSARTIISQFLEVTQRTSVLNGRVDELRCWHHIVFKKEGRNTSLFADGRLVDERDNTTPLKFVTAALLQLANSPCLGVTEERFSGVIDELRIYSRALEFAEILSLFFDPDKIATSDTTIILGEQVRIRLTPTCANFFSWSPGSGVSSVTAAEPVITPTATTTYKLDMGDADCMNTDSIRIVVIDPSLIDCRNVLLPKAFTPNADGLNDNFGISNPIVLDQMDSFEIFSRWGNRVFSAAGKSDRWNGFFEGKEVTPGVYLYKVRYTCNGEKVLKTGSVTVLR